MLPDIMNDKKADRPLLLILMAFFIFAAAFYTGGLLYSCAVVQFLALCYLLLPLRRKPIGLVLILALFTIYALILFGLHIGGSTVNARLLGHFIGKFWHLRSSIASTIDYRLLALLALTDCGAIFLFFLGRNRKVSPQNSAAAVFRPGRIDQISGSVIGRFAAILVFIFTVAAVLSPDTALYSRIEADPASMELINRADIQRQLLKSFAQTPPALSEKRSVLIIMVEALRRKSLPLFGYQRDIAPFLTELAGRSILFNEHYTPSPTSLNAMYSILSGGYAIMPRSGEVPAQPNDPPHITLAEVLKKEGYKTSYFIAGNAEYSNRLAYLKAHGFDQIVDWSDFPEGMRIDSWKMRDDALLDRIAGQLQDGSGPHFILSFLLGTHHPYTLRSDAQPVYARRARGGSDEDYRDRYDDTVALLDHDLKQFVARIDAMPADKRPLLLILGDHGDTFGQGLGEHSDSTKRIDNLFQEVLQVPLLVYDGNSPLTITKRTAHSMIAPLVLSYLQDGPDLFRSRLKSAGYQWLDYDYLLLANPFAEHIYGVIHGNYKFVKYYSRGNGREKLLFDLSADPLERNNLAAEVPAAAAGIEHFLDQAVTYYPLISESIESRNFKPPGPVQESITFNIAKIDGLAVRLNGLVVIDRSVHNVLKRIEFSWGDGQTSQSLFPAFHTYTQAGRYEIHAIARTFNGDLEAVTTAEISPDRSAGPQPPVSSRQR